MIWSLNVGDVTSFSDITAPLVGQAAHFLYALSNVQSQLKLWNLEMVERTVLPKATASMKDASLIVVELAKAFSECINGLIVMKEILCQKNKFYNHAEGTEHVIR